MPRGGKRRGAGRPREIEGDTAAISFKASARQLELLRKLAEKRGKTCGALLREALAELLACGTY